MAGCRSPAAVTLAMLAAIVSAADSDVAASAGRWQVTRVEVNGKLVDHKFTDRPRPREFRSTTAGAEILVTLRRCRVEQK